MSERQNAGWGNDHPCPFQWLHWRDPGHIILRRNALQLAGLHRIAAHLAKRDRNSP